MKYRPVLPFKWGKEFKKIGSQGADCGDEQGRIWFGLREEAISPFPDRVDLGSLVTRVFVLVQDPQGGEREVEPSYTFGQGVWWWDRHYLSMADYEPQYHRLDQLMRWGAVLAWLADQGDLMLPVPEPAADDERWRFDDWLDAHPELTWAYDVPFINVPGQNTETVLVLFSPPYELCGERWFNSGGISNPGIARMHEMADQRPQLPGSLARAGLSRAETDYSAARASGTISEMSGIQRTLSPVLDAHTTIDVLAEGRKVWSLGDIKVGLPETAQRRLDLALSTDAGTLKWQMDVQDVRLGDVAVTVDDMQAAVAWQPGPLAATRDVLEDLQELLSIMPLEDAIEQVLDASETYVDADDGRYHLLVEDGSGTPQQWVIEEGPPPAGDELSFLLAKPSDGPEGGSDDPLTWYVAYRPAKTPASGQGGTPKAK